jgi:hypothetical protein
MNDLSSVVRYRVMVAKAQHPRLLLPLTAKTWMPTSLSA